MSLGPDIIFRQYTIETSIEIVILGCKRLFHATCLILYTPSTEKITQMSNFKFQTIDWNLIPATEHSATTGKAVWRTLQLAGLRIRRVDYSMGYLADHWCKKGHIVHCLEGEFVSELDNGQQFKLSQGMTYIVSDDLSSHRSFSENGVKLLIIDGDFLK